MTIGRRTDQTPKQQTNPKHRYIQTAVRTVQQREQQALAAAGLTAYLPPGTSGGLQRGASIGRWVGGWVYVSSTQPTTMSPCSPHRS